MIKIECSTTNYVVMGAISELFAKLAGNADAAIPEITKVTLDVSAEPVTVAPPVAEPVTVAPPVAEPVTVAPPVAEPIAVAPPVAEPIAVAPPVAEPATDLDGKGLPWDSRINTAAKTRRQSDNTWKLIRGVDPALVKSVKAELAAGLPVTEAPVAVAPPAAEPVPARAGTPATFGGLLQAFTFKQSIGKITADEMNAVCMGHGIASLALIGSRPDLIPAVFADMEALCLTRG